MKIKHFAVYYFLLFVGALLLFLSHPPYYYIGLTFVALIPLIFFISKLKNKYSIFLGSLFFGGVYFYFILNWVLDIGISQIELQMDYFLILKYLFFIILLLIGALSFGIWGLLLKKFQGKNNFVLLGSFSFIILEYLRAFFVSILFWGKESSIAGHWTFGHLGYNLVNYPIFSNLAYFGGIYLLSFVVVFFNLSLFSYRRNDISKKLIIVVTILIIIFAAFSSLNNNTEKLNIGVIQTGGSERADVESLNSIIQDNFSGSDIVVLPENVGRKYLDNHQGNLTYFEFVPGENQMIIFSKYNLDDEGKLKNRVYYINGATDKFVTYDKTFLMPFGEYIPYIFEIFNSKVTDINTVRKGEGILVSSFEGRNIGAIVCGAYMSPILSRSLVNQGQSEIIINLASNSAFGDNKRYRKLNREYSRLRAIENNRYFVQSGHEGYSFVVDNKGNVLHSENIYDSAYFDWDVELIKERSAYSFLGDWLIVFGLFYFVLENYLKTKKD